jgi:hypothetical protein
MKRIVASPLTDAYVWVPRPEDSGVVWDLVTCHDLNVWDGVSHRKLWPQVLEHLAVVRGMDTKLLKYRLRDRHTGLPRGRIIHPESGYVVIHGDDAPATLEDWLELVKVRFRLTVVEVTPELSEHQKMLADDPKAVQTVLGIPLDLKTTA